MTVLTDFPSGLWGNNAAEDDGDNVTYSHGVCIKSYQGLPCSRAVFSGCRYLFYFILSGEKAREI